MPPLDPTRRHALSSFLRGVRANPRARPWVYHVTFASTLEAIAREGIVPQVDGGMSFDAAPLGVYWTSAAGVPFWYGHALEHAGDVPPARRRQSVPVVLRARRPRGLRRDEAGTEDAGADAWYGPEAVSPEAVEAWDGQAWRPVTAWRELPLDLGLRDVLGEDEFLPVEQSPLVPPAGR